jgi:aurora kinase
MQGYVKIGDFGCSIYHNQTSLRNTIVGCMEYSSPEQLSKEGYTDKIDIWSLGILTYELLFGRSPFESDIKKIVLNNEVKAELSEVTFPVAPVIREETKQLILNLLANDPQKRMDID